jgi:hypothetical protein
MKDTPLPVNGYLLVKPLRGGALRNVTLFSGCPEALGWESRLL